MGGESGGHIPNTMPDKSGTLVPIAQEALRIYGDLPHTRTRSGTASEDLGRLREICERDQVDCAECVEAIQLIESVSDDALNGVICSLRRSGHVKTSQWDSHPNVVTQLVMRILMMVAADHYFVG